MEYRTETTKKNADDSHDHIIQKKNYFIGVIRQIITESYKDADFKTLITLFSNEDEQIKERAKEAFAQLLQDPYIQDIITNNKLSIKGDEAIINELFNESEDDALIRLSLESSKIKPEQRQEIEQYQNILISKTMLKNIKNPIEQLRFANTHATILGQDEFNNKLSEFVGNPNKLSTSPKINFILNGHKELTNEIPTAKTDLDKLKQDILAGIEIKQLLADRDITLLNLPSIIKDKNPKLLKELFEASYFSRA